MLQFFQPEKDLLSRVHGANDDPPINKHAAFTVSLWTKVNGTGQSDLRVFSEANTSNSDPLFNIGTNNSGASGRWICSFDRVPGRRRIS